MSNELMIIALVSAIALALAVVVVIQRRRMQERSLRLREQFGPEYERAVAQHGDRTRAEQELLARRKRLDELNIHPLTEEQADRFSADWATVQQRFVDDPASAVGEADVLVKEVMRARGYPLGNFDQRVADLSVEHSNVVEHYRAARALAHARDRGESGTEELRQAMVHYRALFSNLLITRPEYAPMRLSHA